LTRQLRRGLGEVKTRLAGGVLGNLASPGSAMLEMLVEMTAEKSYLPGVLPGLFKIIDNLCI